MKSEADVVIVGGGPAGMMAGLLFARAGIDTLVLEKHGDFLRDFRGDTVHPSTMQILSELGLLDLFLDRPHHRIDNVELNWNGRSLALGDLSHLPVLAPFIAMMPQWDFLDFLRDHAGTRPAFALEMNAEVTGVGRTVDRVSGVTLADGRSVTARKLVLMADGRGSIVRSRNLLPITDLGAPIDVFWFAVPKPAAGNRLRGVIHDNHMLVLIDRGEYWQCAYIIAKGGADAVKARGIERFRADVQAAAPDLPDLDSALPDWDKVRLLTVSLDRLDRWHAPGLLAIGDAAHAMSPVGGVGINLAIQDAVCAANVLAGPMAQAGNVDDLLHKVQDRRLFPTRVIQAAQAAVHRNLLQPVLSGGAEDRSAPLAMRLLDRFARLRRIPGRAIGLGIRREHVRSPEVRAS
jgi:2-polyprenyl-6-methoxyphenol hydroxylase-like FAD-dependent oxidoreductase